MPQIAIVGAGITGLSAAYYAEKIAAQAGLDVHIRLIERQDRLGGVIQTEQTEHYLIDGGPDSFLTQKPAALELCRELGLADQLLPSNDQQRKTYIWLGGRLRELPDGLQFVVPSKIWPVFRSDLFSLAGKIRLACSPLIPPPSNRGEGVTVADFIRERLGQEVLERLAEPLLSAVYGGDVERMSAKATLPQLVALEEKYGSLWKGIQQSRRQPRQSNPQNKQSLFMTLRKGLGELTGALEKKLISTEILRGTAIQKILRDGDGNYQLQWPSGEMKADALILALPAYAASQLLRTVSGPLAGKLGEIPYHSSLIVSLGFEDAEAARGLKGFGFLVPRGEGKTVIACTRMSTKFSHRASPGHVLLRCFLGGARQPAVMDESDERILELTLGDLKEMIGLRVKPNYVRIFRWKNCMAQYDTGHLKRLEEITSLLAELPGLYLAGNGYRGIGIPDCVQSAAVAAGAAVARVKMGT